MVQYLRQYRLPISAGKLLNLFPLKSSLCRSFKFWTSGLILVSWLLLIFSTVRFFKTHNLGETFFTFPVKNYCDYLNWNIYMNWVAIMTVSSELYFQFVFFFVFFLIIFGKIPVIIWILRTVRFFKTHKRVDTFFTFPVEIDCDYLD